MILKDKRVAIPTLSEESIRVSGLKIFPLHRLSIRNGSRFDGSRCIPFLDWITSAGMGSEILVAYQNGSSTMFTIFNMLSSERYAVGSRRQTWASSKISDWPVQMDFYYHNTMSSDEPPTQRQMEAVISRTQQPTNQAPPFLPLAARRGRSCGRAVPIRRGESREQDLRL